MFASVAAFSVAILKPYGVAAQTNEAPEGEVALARDYFIRGTQATEELRWDDAERHFRRAYELSGAASALMNVGLSLRALGRHLEARQVFHELLEKPLLPQGMDRDRIRQLRDEADAKVAELRIGRLKPRQRYRLTLDGQRRKDFGSRPWVIETDPGNHALWIDFEGHERFTWNGALEAGQVFDLTPKFEKLRSRPLRRNPWLWVSVSLVVVGGAVAAGVLLRDSGGLEPQSDIRVDL